MERQDDLARREIAYLARPLRDTADLDPLIDRIGDARFVLLGEASRGTADYYRWRADLTRRLIAEQGFSFVAVEGDWPDCFRVNRWVKDREGRDESASAISAAVTGPGRSVDDLLASVNLRTRSTYASAAAAAVTAAGFEVLPTFAAPHVSIVWPKYDEQAAEALLAVLGPIQQNPYRERRSR